MLVGRFLHNKPDDGRHLEAIGGWDTHKTIFRLNDLFFSGEIKVMLTQNGRVFYGISQIKNITDSTKDLLGEIPTIPSISDETIKLNFGTDVNIPRYSITAADDATYLAAVRSGDMETAQRMVDEAAAWITIKESVEHGHRIYSVEGMQITALPPTVRRALTNHNSAGNAVIGIKPNCVTGVNTQSEKTRYWKIA